MSEKETATELLDKAGGGKPAYRVLARKYRPQGFDELIGQDALVRTLTNAINSGRIAQAYMLTGIRGTGKTTTARIIAKALNYTGPDGKGGPTAGNTEDCDTCRAIAEGRHPDVMEMDAASRTGVDDIREILDGVRYAPASARYKVYIIDEVHMLSKGAFNALLKTLEEPPPHVIFIFATTEIRKVPVTVLSRCQRFDLRRVDVPTLTAHYGAVAAKEGVTFEDEAIAMIARAADGSVRDGLSLLDQAIAMSDGKITALQVQEMLGLSDRFLVLDCLEKALRGDASGALAIAEDLYRKGGDPAVLIEDMLEYIHRMTRAKAAPNDKEINGMLPADIAVRLAGQASALSMPTLGRAWQILLKGLAEVQAAPRAQTAAEMVLIRLIYAANLPDPADLIKRIQSGAPDGGGQSYPAGSRAGTGGGNGGGNGGGPAYAPNAAAPPAGRFDTLTGMPAQSAVQVIAPAGDAHDVPQIETLEALEEALRKNGHMILAGEVFRHMQPVRFEIGRIEYCQKPEARATLASDLTKTLREMTGERWVVTVVSAPRSPSDAAPGLTLAERRDAAQAATMAEVREHPVVKGVLLAFPGAEIKIAPSRDPA